MGRGLDQDVPARFQFGQNDRAPTWRLNVKNQFLQNLFGGFHREVLCSRSVASHSPPEWASSISKESALRLDGKGSTGSRSSAVSHRERK